jgi:ABC-2 type transport system permease protein
MLRETMALTVRELKHWYRVKVQVFMTMMMPLVWLGLFGQAFRLEELAAGPGVPPEMIQGLFAGAPNYFSFMAIGMLCVMVLFTCMFSGMSVVWDRRFGFLTKLQVAPIPRGIIPMSRVLSSVTRALIQSIIIFIIALVFAFIPGMVGLELGSSFGIIELLLMVVILALLALGFAAIFTTIALTIENQETLIGVINLLNLPLMFASAALFPTSFMPDWLKSVANLNPITWAADGIRQLVFEDPQPIYDLPIDILGLVIFAGAFLLLGWFLARRVLNR